MKTSNLVSFAMVLALGALVGCGKKSSKSNAGYVCGVNVSCGAYSGNPTQINDQASILAKQTELAGIFNAKTVSAGTQVNMGAVFIKGGYSSSEARIFGINLGFNVNSYSQSCDFVAVQQKDTGGSPFIVLGKASGTCNQTVPALTYSTFNESDKAALSPDIGKALNSLATNIITRGVYVNIAGFNTQTTSLIAYSILVPSSPFSTALIEYVIVPDLPTFMNPVATYNQATGAFKMLNGIQFY